MQKVGRLELTWVGKYEEDRFEPRILIEDKEKSYGDASSDNMLIHGDNLLALKALERDYTGKIRCIYIEIIIEKWIHGIRKIKKCDLAV